MSTSDTSTAPARRRLPVRRDSVMFALGWAGIGYQQMTAQVSVPLLIVYGVAIGLPGVAALLSAISGLTASPPSASPPAVSPSSSA